MSQSVIPSQVEEAAELAEKLFEQMNKATKVEEEEEITSDEDPSDEEDDLEDEEEIEEEEEELDPKELKKWRDRYLTLQGKYNAEVPRLASQLKELQEQLTKAPSKEVADASVEDEDDFEAVYGADFVDNIRKLINKTVQQEIKPVTEKVDLVETTQRNDAAESFKSYLDENAEGWRDLWEGKDKGFVKFLEQPDPSGLYTNGELLGMYNERWDADKMVKLFNLYKGDKAPTKQKESLSKEQEAMIAPSRSKTNAEPASKEKKIWTQDSMKEFEQKDRQGKYSDEESQAMWADLLAAANEGRIR